MKTRLLFVSLIVFVFALSIASAASYGLYVSNPALVGKDKLEPGVYTMKVEGNNVTFTHTKSKKVLSATAKEVQKSDTKIEYNEIVGPKGADGVQKVNAIQIGGYNMKVVFE